MVSFQLSKEQIADYYRDGYLIIKNFLNAEETKTIQKIDFEDGDSHKMGRVKHRVSGEQVGASQHYVDLALKTMELVYVELDPGDALIFHSNLLHRSAANLSQQSRWSLISVYNRSSNIPYNQPSN